MAGADLANWHDTPGPCIEQLLQAQLRCGRVERLATLSDILFAILVIIVQLAKLIIREECGRIAIGSALVPLKLPPCLCERLGKGFTLGKDDEQLEQALGA